jgi:hypothetical protein
MENYKRFGALPTDTTKTTDALARVIDMVPPDRDHIDTGTVFVIASIMWALKKADYPEAYILLHSVGRVNNALGRQAYHHTPLDVLGDCLAVFGTIPDIARKQAVDVLLGIKTVDEAIIDFEKGLEKEEDTKNAG